MTKTYKAHLIIKTSKSKILKTELKRGHWAEDVEKLIDVGTFSFEETTNVKFRDIERGNELILKMVDKNGNKHDYYYWVESVGTHYKRDEKTGKIITNEIILKCSSYPSILTKNSIEGMHMFKQGYGELVKTYAKKFGFDVSGIKMINKNGFIYFTRMSLLESFRRMAYIERWCFNFRDKRIVFGPCTSPEDSGVVLTSNEILEGTFTK